MPRRTYNLAELQPDELNELKRLVSEFISRQKAIDAEIADLRESKRDLNHEYEGKLDMRTMGIVMRIMNAERSVQHRDTFDLYMEAVAKADGRRPEE